MLRESTANLHEAVDSAVGDFSSLETYRRYLLDMSAFRLRVEDSLKTVDWPAALNGWRPTMVSAALQQDLDDLELDVPHSETPPAPVGIDEIIGTLYVLQGSSLGAQVLLRRAQELGLSAEMGARHLAAQAGGTTQWRGFLDILEGVPRLDMETVSRASCMTFQLARAAFQSAIPA